MSDTHVIIIGTGAEGRIAADIFAAAGIIVLGFLETAEEISTRDLNDISVFAIAGSEDSKMVLQDNKVQFLVAVGDIKLRKAVYERVAEISKRPAANAQHPGAWISPYAAIGFGNLFNYGVAVNANTQIGDNNLVHSGAVIEPDVTIGNYCTVSAGARIGTNASLEDNVFIGTGAIVHPGVKIGKGAMIGAGSVVLREVEEGTTVFGNPAQAVE
ncbi:MAG: NeuD/PglB/VioB family sugar acetyltransferase [Bacteroidota bacterium]